MSSVSLMECNAKPSLQWDWENLIMFNVAAADNPKRTSTTVWGIDGEKGFDSGSFYSSGGASGSGGSGSDFGIAPLSKSLNSASISSSSIGDGRTSKPALEGSEAIQDNFYSQKPFTKAKLGGTCVLEASVGSGEPLLGLKLGKRTYFEDVGTGSNAKSSSIPVFAISSATSTKRSKSGSQGLQAPRCQVEGCNLDLSSAKDYHRKHKVCESHSKCPKVIVAGEERRFCQQCSRFHGLSEFDEKKRSCRKRLSDHNARRRKPQTASVQLNPTRMSSSYCDEKQQISFAWNRVPPAQARRKANHTWEGSSGSKFTLTKEYLLKRPKIGGIDVQLHLPDSQLTSTIPLHGQYTNGLLSCKAKGTTSAVLNQDLEESFITSNVDANQDLHRALSLLSTNSWGLPESKSPHLGQPVRTNHNSVLQSVLHTIPPGLPLTSLGSWRPRHQSTEAQVQTFAPTNDCSNYFQEFQFPRTPYESDFDSVQMN